MQKANFRRYKDTIYYWDTHKYGDITKAKNVIYLLVSADKKEYIGSTSNMSRRISSHLRKTNDCKFEPPYANGLGLSKSVEVSILAHIENDTDRRQVEHQLIVRRAQELIKKMNGVDVPEFAIHKYRPLWNNTLLNTLS